MDIRSKLKTLLPRGQFDSSKREFIVRCPYCGHTSSHGKNHLYMSVYPTADKPYVFNCFKCGEKGLINRTFLELIGIDDQSIVEEVTDHNNELLTKRRGSYNGNFNKKIYAPKYAPEKIQYDLFSPKQDYINKRLNSFITLSEMMSMKIIFDFTFLKARIKRTLRCSDSDFDVIQREYVGFLSANNTMVVLRHILDNDLPRYIIIKLTEDEPTKMYVIPAQIQLREKVKVYIAEGQFDILSIYNNINLRSRGVYIAAAGNRYASCIEYILSKGIMDMELHLYFDNDDAGETAFNHLKYFINNNLAIFRDTDIYIHRNICPNQKDYGTSIDKIQDSYTIL